LESLSRQDFQNDSRFAMALARSRQAAGYGPVRIRAELAQHSLGAELIAETMASLSDDWLDTAQGLVARRYLRKIQSDPAQSRKAADFLLRRGFDQKTAFTAVKIREWPVAPDLIDESP
jgi:regulatory protein